jgi:hypothetical protein
VDLPFDVHDEHLRTAWTLNTGYYQHAADFKAMTWGFDVDWTKGEVRDADDRPAPGAVSSVTGGF